MDIAETLYIPACGSEQALRGNVRSVLPRVGVFVVQERLYFTLWV